MAEYVTAIRTPDGDKPIDYNALANKPKVNGKDLTGDLQLTASDVGAFSVPQGTKGQLLGYVSNNKLGAISSVPVERGGTGVTSMEDKVHTTVRYRGSALYKQESDIPSEKVEGAIYWIYGE